MGLDIEALRKKMEELNERKNRSGNGGGGRIKYWKPKQGRNVIRILPGKNGNDFYAEARVRYNVGPNKKRVVVPLDPDEACPIKDFVDALYKSGDKDDEKLAKKMRATNRYLFNVIDRSVEEGQEGYGEVMVYECGPSVFTDILSIICDPDYGDITDPENGWDIIITKTGKDLETEYKVNARPKQSPIGIEGWEEKLYDLQKLATPVPYEKRAKLLEGDNSDDNDENEDEKPRRETKPSKSFSIPDNEDYEDDEDLNEEFDESEADDIEAEIQALLKKNKRS